LGNITNIASGNSSLTLQTGSGNTTAVTVDTSQNVGIGVTPSAWVSTWSALQVKNGSIAGFSNRMYVNANSYFDGSNNRYIATDVATRYYQVNGIHAWEAAPSGTAGNAITFTQVLAVEKAKSLALEGATSVSGTGISFPATQSASTDANTLDDYEEGTWTPDVRAGGSSTWTQKNGYYRKVGSLVNAYFVCDGNNSGTSGNLTLYGLPFAIGTIGGFVTFGIWSANSLSVPNGGFVQNSTGATSMNIYTGGSQVSGQTTYISGMISYHTA